MGSTDALPGDSRKSDGQLLFLLHMISKLPRIARTHRRHHERLLCSMETLVVVVEIRRLLMEEDMVDAIIAAHRPVLQHRHCHLHLDRHQP